MIARASTTRRNFLAGGACLCCLPGARRAFAAPGPFATAEIAEGIHIRRGLDEDATQDNDDAIANIGFIIGRDAVLVTDPGGSLADGENLRATIKRMTDLPIKYVVMSHVHPDHIFGAGAFRRDEPVYVGHIRLAEALRQRGDYYSSALAKVLGPKSVGAPVAPNMEVREKAEIDLGDRIIEATAHPTAHTMTDLSLLDKKTGVLLPADLVFVGRVPSLDGSLQGWLKELAKLKQIGALRIVPGHGPVSVEWPAGAASIELYLAILERETRQAIANGIDIEAAISTVAQSERGKWKLFDDYNGRNVTEAYKELEWQ
ncbi:quinoprotein relay system zinc metallohydrolase 2 [Methylocapsa polymorpha]|uniref:Quinoprotein relay system zinc metallohydrolase 2 n=1 Tax=Methylocapsa polymorpha TaxID=3080828 RepID=A0ABZ0HRP1_9HYPH|nr:quinoprotein relay system zinc metallohydrolase 2 [Methylocapsa sp. RX1]